MARIHTVIESNGPDRFNMHPGCSDHHAGARTGITDFCCCCDPCNYFRRYSSAAQPEDRFCCRCFPRLILARFTAANDSECCRNTVVPMLAAIQDDTSVGYFGNIVGYDVQVLLSNDAVGSPGDPYGGGCRWTIRVPYLGIDQDIDIDHRVVTCLGVPAMSITNIVAFEGCVGSLSLTNYSTVKVPFHVRGLADAYAEPESITVPFPPGFVCAGCDSLPRYICVTKKHNRVNRIRSPRLPWEIEWWREFRWDEDFNPYEEYERQEWIVGRWRYAPDDSSEFESLLYLVQDGYGACFLQPDFASPPGTAGEGETYQRVPLSSCGCDFKILNVRPIDDPAPPLVPGESLPADLVGIDYRGGRCGCWDYHCGRRRCVPRYLCGFLFVNNTLYRNILFSWDNVTKCWLSQGGIDLAGYSMPFELRVRLERGDAGQCQFAVSFEDYDIAPSPVGDLDTVVSVTLEGHSYAGADYFSLNLNTSFDEDCSLRVTCVTATPCAADCGSHPSVLYLRLHGWSLPSDYPPPPVTGECTTEIVLVYRQTVVVTGANIVISCGYVGYALVESYYSDPITGFSGVGTFLIKAELSMGLLKIFRKLASDPNDYLPVETAVLAESCNPYYGYKLTPASLKNCFFGNQAIVWHRWEAEVTE